MRRYLWILLGVFLLSACGPVATEEVSAQTVEPMTEDAPVSPVEDTHEIYFAGGCFWGVEAFFERLPGVMDVVSGYANGEGEASYSNIMRGSTGYAETVRVRYNRNAVSLPALTHAYLQIIDPFSVNRQGNDVGDQYRTGIYAVNEQDLAVVKAVVEKVAANHTRPFAVELQTLVNFTDAEEMHQDYLTKNPNGYCHVDLGLAEKPMLPGEWPTPSDAELKEALTPLQYQVSRERGTEPAFDNPYDREYAPGIYVDIANGQPLFRSDDKFDSGTGWPSFSKGITPDVFLLEKDSRLGMERISVTAKESGTHLGHVFPDGPQELGGLRFCMNSASLRFIPLDEMEQEGYGEFIPWIEGK